VGRWPTLKAVQLARRTTLEHFFRAHHVRSADVITTRLEAIKNARALTTDDGISAYSAISWGGIGVLLGCLHDGLGPLVGLAAPFHTCTITQL
jgi:hypothetical protein